MLARPPFLQGGIKALSDTGAAAAGESNSTVLASALLRFFQSSTRIKIQVSTYNIRKIPDKYMGKGLEASDIIER